MASTDPPQGPPATLHMPLRMERISLEKVWGGRALERVLGVELDREGPVGETWELVDRGEENSVVRGGPFDGQPLRDLVATEREALLGETRTNEDGRFPVLIKFISASQPLSVQVHPDDRSAKRLHAGECGKTESWYILDAEPGSLVYLGLQADVDMAAFGAVAAGPGVVDMLQPWPARAGQFVHIPAGTLHAIGEGITLLEVQQNSDVTFRLYDWGRRGLDGKPRETHVDKALLAINYEQPIPGPIEPEYESSGGDNRMAELVDCEHYTMTLHEVGSHVELETEGRARALVVVGGSARLWIGDEHEPMALETGDTWLIPAALGPFRVESEGELVRLIAVDTKT